MRLSVTIILIITYLGAFSQTISKKGSVDRVEIIRTEWYAPNYAKYIPNSKDMSKLIQLWDNDLKVDLVFGFWCSDSHTNVPGFLRVTDSLLIAQKKVNIRFISTDKSKTYDENKRVEYVPTFIIYKSGIEIGRIVENPQKSFEKDLLAIILNYRKKKKMIRTTVTPDF